MRRRTEKQTAWRSPAIYHLHGETPRAPVCGWPRLPPGPLSLSPHLESRCFCSIISTRIQPRACRYPDCGASEISRVATTRLAARHLGNTADPCSSIAPTQPIAVARSFHLTTSTLVMPSAQCSPPPPELPPQAAAPLATALPPIPSLALSPSLLSFFLLPPTHTHSTRRDFRPFVRFEPQPPPNHQFCRPSFIGKTNLKSNFSPLQPG